MWLGGGAINKVIEEADHWQDNDLNEVSRTCRWDFFRDKKKTN